MHLRYFIMKCRCVSWDAAVSLHGMLEIPEEMKQFVSDYPMHLIEARKNDLKLHNINNRDLFNLLAILLNRSGKLSETRQKAQEYLTTFGRS